MGLWISIGLAVGSILVGYLRAKYAQSQAESAPRAEKQPFNRGTVPTVEAGLAIPIVYGTALVRAPIVASYETMNSHPVREVVEHTWSPDSSRIVAYRYSVDMYMVIGIGPELAGSDIRVDRVFMDEKEIVGVDDAVTGSGGVEEVVAISKPSLWGGKGAGGGVSGQIQFDYDGSQFSGLISAWLHLNPFGESPQIPPISFETHTIPGGDYDGGVSNSTATDANPMAVIHDILTQQWGKGGTLTDADIDAVSFLAAAETLRDEGNLISCVIYNETEAREVIAQIMKQIDGILYEDDNQKVAIALVRDDYDPDGLESFDEADIEEVMSFSSTSPVDTVNQVIVEFENRDKNYNKDIAQSPNMANWRTSGDQKSPTTIQFPLCKIKDLAEKLAEREQMTLSQPQSSVKLRCNRGMAHLRPGDVFKWSWEEYGITDAVLRVTDYDLGELDDGRVILECVRDQFGAGITGAITPAGTEFELPNPEPMTPASEGGTVVIMELPRWHGAKMETARNQESREDPILIILAKLHDAYSQFFIPEISTDGGTVYGRTGDQPLDFTKTANLDTAMNREDEPYYTDAAGITISAVEDASLLRNSTRLEIETEGKGLLLVDDEFIAYESFTDNGDDTYTLTNIWRGLLDTVPVDHAADAIVFFLNSLDGRLPSRFVEAESINLRMIPHTGLKELDAGDAPVTALTIQNRANLPYPPADMKAYAGQEDDTATPLKTGLVAWDAVLDIAGNQRDYRSEDIRRGDDVRDDETAIFDDNLFPPDGAQFFYDFLAKLDADASDTLIGQLTADPDGEIGGPLLCAGEFDVRSIGVGQGSIGIQSRIHLSDGSDRKALQIPRIDVLFPFAMQLLLDRDFESNVFDGTGDWGVTGSASGATGPLGGAGISPEATTGIANIGQAMDVLNRDPVGKVAQLRIYARANGAGNNIATILAIDADNVLIDTSSFAVNSKTDQWEEIVATLSLPVGTAKIAPSISLDASDETAVDAVDLRIANGFSGQLLLNASFEFGQTSWITALGTWDVQAGPVGTLDELDGTQLLHTDGGDVSHEIYQEVDVPAGYGEGDVAHLRIWQGDTAAGGNGWALIEAKDSTGTTIGHESLEAVSTGGWKRRELFLTIPANTAKLKVRLLAEPGASGGIGFDSILLEIFDVTTAVNSHSLSLSAASSQYVTIPDSPALDSDAFTFAIWFRPRSKPGSGTDWYIADRESGGGGWRMFLVKSGTGDSWLFRLGINGGSYLVTCPITIATDQWAHLAASYDPTAATVADAMKIIVDGADQNATMVIGTGTDSPPAIGDSGSVLAIGARTSGALPADGDFDDARYWTVARTAAQVLADKDSELDGNEAGIEANLKFNADLDDATGNGHDGTGVNSPTFSTDTPF